MNWQDELAELVRNAKRPPTFREWLAAGGYAKISHSLPNPVQMQSLMRTLYRQYQNEFPEAA